MLILFDIDGTLITSRSEVDDGGSRDGVGTASMIEAGRKLYGPTFTLRGVEIAGRLDALIWRDAARMNGLNDVESEHQRFRDEYARILKGRLDRGARVRLLPGVKQLVDRLAGSETLTLGLLTGNYPETGCMKIKAAGLDPDMFPVGAWGCEGTCRRDLTPVAIDRHAKIKGKRLPSQRVVIIGDTPHDVDCAKAHGCRSIGVATGQFTIESLQEAGADLAVPDLTGTEAIIDWIHA